ncbi:hypothetical protein G5V57_31330 [Nordella sp. HKS 07]|uniref:hypothetical protein n=1 Tax=Nordella sp. HKS 07 TaxID=2712222 RepID=UPI0013E1C4BC|nr:hypothetical protein [Nordella sp. HKS 07]QIG51808.1 hypothetical protein G5V57_31330 [Nordella sp. HKS 07]
MAYPVTAIWVLASHEDLPLSWIEHLNPDAGFASLVSVVAAKVANPETKAALLTTAKVIDQHIEKGIDNTEADLVELSNFPDFDVTTSARTP